jgi:hypothetical protein
MDNVVLPVLVVLIFIRMVCTPLLLGNDGHFRCDDDPCRTATAAFSPFSYCYDDQGTERMTRSYTVWYASFFVL